MSTSTVSRAQALLDAGRSAEAIGLLATALAETPESPDLLCTLSRAYVQAGEYDQALKAAERAIAADPESAQAFLLLSLALARLEALDEAIQAARQAVRFAPSAWWAHAHLSNVLARLRPAPTEAMVEAKRAVELAPDEAGAHFCLGVAAAETGFHDEAIAAYRKTLSVDPTHAGALNNLGALQMEQNKLTSAARDLRAGAAADPRTDSAKHNIDVLAWMLARRFFCGVLIIYLVMGQLYRTIAPLAYIAVAGAGLLILLATVVRTDNRLPQALRSYYRRLLVRNHTLAMTVGLLVAALLLVMCLGLPVSDTAKFGVRLGAAGCLLLTTIGWIQARRQLATSKSRLHTTPRRSP